MRSFLFFIAFFCAFVPACFGETFIIDTPGMCVQVEKVENNRVYLKKPSAPCPVEGPGKASVEMDEGTKRDRRLRGRHGLAEVPRCVLLSPEDSLKHRGEGNEGGRTSSLSRRTSTKKRP